MTSLGLFSEEELELVSNIGFIIAPSERLGEGFTVQVIDGLRTWSCATKFGQIMVKGAPASFSGSYTLSPRFVRIAEHLACVEGRIRRVCLANTDGRDGGSRRPDHL